MPHVAKRKMGIVSRGDSLMAAAYDHISSAIGAAVGG
jgi:thiamine biosynthesis protein ThiC